MKLCAKKVLGLLVLADKYNIPDLKDSCSVYMRNHLVSLPDQSKAIVWYQYALACNSTHLQQTCLNYIVLNMDTVIQSADWIYLDRDNLIMILERSDMIVESEYVLLQAVVRWLSDEARSTDDMRDHLRDVLPYIRFPMILPEHLAEFEESAFEREHHQLFAAYMLAAYRYHALSIKGRKEAVSGTAASGVPALQYAYRNYSDDTYSIHVDVVRKSIRSCPRVSSKVERPLSLPTSVCNVAQERQCKMKVTFYPQGFYTTSLWNGQLNLAKSTDQTRLVVSHRGGVELRTAEVSVVIYAQQNDVRYVDYAITRRHTFETYGAYEIDNVIDIDRLKADASSFVIDGAVHIKVFVRPITFHNNVSPMPM